VKDFVKVSVAFTQIFLKISLETIGFCHIYLLASIHYSKKISIKVGKNLMLDKIFSE